MATLDYTAVSAALAREGYTVTPTAVADAAVLAARSGTLDATSLAAALERRLGHNGVPEWAVRKAIAAAVPASRPPAEQVIRDFFRVDEASARPDSHRRRP